MKESDLGGEELHMVSMISISNLVVMHIQYEYELPLDNWLVAAKRY